MEATIRLRERLCRNVPGPIIRNALCWMQSRRARWDGAAPIQAIGAYSKRGRINPLYAVIRPVLSRIRDALRRKPMRQVARTARLWRWGRKERVASNVIPRSNSLLVISIGMSPKVSIGTGVVWRLRQMSMHCILVGSKRSSNVVPSRTGCLENIVLK